MKELIKAVEFSRRLRNLMMKCAVWTACRCKERRRAVICEVERPIVERVVEEILKILAAEPRSTG